MFRPEFFDSEERQEEIEEYVKCLLDTLDELDVYVDDFEEKFDDIYGEIPEEATSYIDNCLVDMRKASETIRDHGEGLLQGNLTGEDISYLGRVYYDLNLIKANLESVVIFYENHLKDRRE
ncbi:MAG: hypothetical protein ACLFS3_00070 [Candidatus Aenigmatarchaeota archaeon]